MKAPSVSHIIDPKGRQVTCVTGVRLSNKRPSVLRAAKDMGIETIKTQSSERIGPKTRYVSGVYSW